MMSLPGKKIVCRVRVDDQAKAVEFTWSEGSASFKPYALEGDQLADFRANVQVARERLLDLVLQYQRPVAERDAKVFRQASLNLALAGRDLHNLIFDPAARDGGGIVDIARWLAELTESGEVDSLEVVCDGQSWFAPWNLVYDKDPEESAFHDGMAGYEPFWGMRYNLCGGQPVDPLRRMPLPNKPNILVVVDPVVLDGLGDYAEVGGTNQRQRFERFLADRGLTPVTSTAALGKALKERRPHMIYWLGHAGPDALHLGAEKLDQTALRNLLRGTKRVPGQTGGLVFLNCCRTAEPGNLGSFLKTFHAAEFSGLIATEEQTLDSFAGPFGQAFLERFLAPGTSIGGLLHEMRRSHGPLALLYGTYCPPDLHLRSEPGEAGPSGLATAGTLTASGGRMLGAVRGAVAERVRKARPLPDCPYLPLGAYGPEHRALFGGRDDDIARFALILDRPETRLLVLHGESAVGKSSFLRAGLIPFLEEDCLGYRFLRDRSGDERGHDASPVLFVRATDDPAGQIAQALVEFAAKPLRYSTPDGKTVHADLPAVLAESVGLPEPPTAADLAEQLLADPSQLARTLAFLAHALPVTPVLVVDQAEEMFTLARSPEEEHGRDRVLEMFRQVGERGGDFKLIVSLRTEYYGRLVSTLRRGLTDAEGVREYLLNDLDVPALVEVIRRPTLRERLPYAAEIPFEKYLGFEFDEEVPEAIARAVERHGRKDGVALLLQVVCAHLFERVGTRDDRRVTGEDLRQVGGFEGALSRHAEDQIAALFPTEKYDRTQFQWLLTGLTLRQGDGTLTTDVCREDSLLRAWGGRTPFDRVLSQACELRLLRTTTRRLDGIHEERLVSLGHDALAKVAEPWRHELEQRAERIKWRKQAALVTAAAVMALAFVGVWVRSEGRERDRKQATARAVEHALNQAHELELAGRLAEATQLASVAQERLDFALPNDPLKLRAATQLQRYSDRERDRQFVAELEEARTVGMEDMRSPPQGLYGSETNELPYRRVFLAHGLDVEGLPTQEVTRQLLARPVEVHAPAAAALEEWAMHSGQSANERLRTIARQVDRDPLRETIRTALAGKQTTTLRALARNLDVTIVPELTFEQLGLALQQLRAFPAAVDLLRRAQRHYPNDFRLNIALGSALLAEGNPGSIEEAISCFAASVAIRPNRPGVLAQLARALGKAGRAQEAIVTLDEAIRDHSPNPDLYNVRGNAFAQLKEYDKAIADYTEAIRIDPKFVRGHSNRAGPQGEGGPRGRHRRLHRGGPYRPQEPRRVQLPWSGTGCQEGVRQGDRRLQRGDPT